MVRGWIYLITEETLAELIDNAQPSTYWQFVIDHRMRKIGRALMARHPNLLLGSWSANRTMHDKTILIQSTNTTWMLTHNMTRGSFSLSTNRAVKITSQGLTERLMESWCHDWKRAKALPR
jgi:hypothetical protein